MVSSLTISHGPFARATVRCTAAAAALLVCQLGNLALAQPALQPQGSFEPGRILVTPKAGLPDAALANILKSNGGGNGRRIGKSELRIVDLPVGQEQQMVQRLLKHPHIKSAELDMRGQFAMATTDPYLGSQWHTTKIGAHTAWDTTLGVGVTIAVLDTGVDCTHPDLSASCVPGWNFVSGNSNPADDLGHGTKAAGAAAAVMNNSVGVAGVAGKASIMPLKIGSSAGFTYSNVASALTYAADRGVRVANMSLYGTLGSSTIVNAAQYFKSKGGLVVNSAGNDGANPGWAASTAMITVSATDSADGQPSWSNFGSYVTAAAPGVGIWTTTMGGGYGAVNGTSFSAPVTAGVIALMMAANPKLSNAEIEALLKSTALDLGTAGFDPKFGYGRINAQAAVAAALAATSTSDTTAPAAGISAPLGGSSVSGLVAVSVTATDNVGVSKVDLFANGSLVGTDTSAPFGFSWDTTKYANGSVSLVAKAYDAAGNTGSSNSVSVTVSNAMLADSTPPVVAISNPTNGSLVKGKVSISVSASDNAGAAGIKQTLLINGSVVAQASGGSLKYSWNTTKLAAGAYRIDAQATDAAGNRSVTTVNVTH